MNLPTDLIHDPRSSYGRLVFPLLKGWLAWFSRYGLRRTDNNGFHNCRVTGVK